jgi:hypothetical protein
MNAHRYLTGLVVVALFGSALLSEEQHPSGK